jgi:hypothetical protein
MKKVNAPTQAAIIMSAQCVWGNSQPQPADLAQPWFGARVVSKNKSQADL